MTPLVEARSSPACADHLNLLDLATTIGATSGSALGAIGGSLLSKACLEGEYPIVCATLGCTIGCVFLALLGCVFAAAAGGTAGDDVSH